MTCSGPQLVRTRCVTGMVTPTARYLPSSCDDLGGNLNIVSTIRRARRSCGSGGLDGSPMIASKVSQLVVLIRRFCVLLTLRRSQLGPDPNIDGPGDLAR